MVMAPLFVKYHDKNGQHYVYDVRSGEILRIGSTIYQILDDYHILTKSEMLAKYPTVSEKAVFDAVEQLDRLQSLNVLLDHAPAPTFAPQQIICGKESEPVLSFLNRHRRMLTLELTHHCNLACEYCCFGQHYRRSRNDSQAVMPLETAKKAVQQFVAHKPTEIAISFYGGEPLLEFDLIKEIVSFAERLADDHGKQPQFSMTTNGTLLTDTVIHFLVEHRFIILISIDGEKEAHDQYRVFKTKGPQGERIGSYDVVIQNMTRFVELYPDYLGRGLTITITATSNVDKIDHFIRQWKVAFPTILVNMVTDVANNLRVTNGDHLLEFGLGRSASCDDSFCSHRYPAGVDGFLPGKSCSFANCDKCECTVVPEFDLWSNEVWQHRQAGRRAYLVKLCQATDANTAKSTAGISEVNRVFAIGTAQHIHDRPVFGKSRHLPATIRLSCIPGSSRTYCSTTGTLYPCEKVEFGRPFIIGNVDEDVDPHRAYRLADVLRLHCDCGNCVLDRLCLLCPAQMTESTDDPGNFDSLEVRQVCKRYTSGLVERLREYSEIMESNPHVLDWLEGGFATDDTDWLNDVKVQIKKPENVELPVEELKGFL